MKPGNPANLTGKSSNWTSKSAHVMTPKVEPISRRLKVKWGKWKQRIEQQIKQLDKKYWASKTGKWSAKRYISLKKGAQIKSYLISHALMTAGFKIWKEIHLYTDQRLTLRILYCKCLNLYLVFVKIYLIRIKCLGGRCCGCIQTASRRCVLKIYWLSRLKIFGPQRLLCNIKMDLLGT